MPRSSYLRSLVSAPEPGTPALRPARPAIWGTIAPKAESLSPSNLNPVASTESEHSDLGSSTVVERGTPTGVRDEPATAIPEGDLDSAKVMTAPRLVSMLAEAPPASLEPKSALAHSDRAPLVSSSKTEAAATSIIREVIRFEQPERRASVRKRGENTIHADRRDLSRSESRSSASTPSEPTSLHGRASTIPTSIPTSMPRQIVQDREADGRESGRERRWEQPEERIRNAPVPDEPNALVPLQQQTVESPTRVDAPAGNTVHIGTLDIQIVPPAPAMGQPSARSSPAQARAVIARGFISSFGLRQA